MKQEVRKGLNHTPLNSYESPLSPIKSLLITVELPVVLHRAVAEVSKIGNL